MKLTQKQREELITISALSKALAKDVLNRKTNKKKGGGKVERKDHSVLAPSSKEWIHCGHSARFLAEKEEETSEASEFGFECHALAELDIKIALDLKDFGEKRIGKKLIAFVGQFLEMDYVSGRA